MNPYLSEEGSKMLFSGDLTQEFPWLIDYEKVLDEQAENTRTYRAFSHALDRLETRNPRKGRLLDIGCGSGHFLNLAKSRGWQCYGLDFEAKSAAKVSSRYQIPVHSGLLQNAPFAPLSFQVITLWDYFEHVENPVEILARISSLLAPGGTLVIACPNHKSLLFFAAIVLNRLSAGRAFLHPLRLLYPPTHLSYFDPDFLAKTVPAHGFKELERDYDETDVQRIQLSPVLKTAVQALFLLARPLKLSNRFILHLQKQS